MFDLPDKGGDDLSLAKQATHVAMPILHHPLRIVIDFNKPQSTTPLQARDFPNPQLRNTKTHTHSKMPPARRSRTSSGPAPKGSQQTLSFGNKVTKPVPLPKDLDKASAPSPLSKTVPIESESEVVELDTGRVSSDAAVAQQARAELEEEGKSAEELRAEKVTDAQIKRYWRERENERRTKRVHQEGLGVEEKILRLFDMSSQFGVSLALKLAVPSL